MSDNSFINNKYVLDQIELIELAAEYRGELLRLFKESRNVPKKRRLLQAMDRQNQVIRHHTRNIIKYIREMHNGLESKRQRTE